MRRVREHVPVGCLSNTNSGHWDEHFGTWPIKDMFDFRVPVLRARAAQAGPRALRPRRASSCPRRPSAVLFLDDNQLNVDGALDAGFAAARVRGVAEAEQALVAAGVLPAASSG